MGERLDANRVNAVIGNSRKLKQNEEESELTKLSELKPGLGSNSWKMIFDV